MADPASRLGTRVAYGASQLPRFAWYVGHGVLMRQLSDWMRRSGRSTRPRARTEAPVPGRGRLYADMASLFQQDLANVEAGIYPLPDDHDGSLPALLYRSRLFFQDLPEIHRRRESGDHQEVLHEAMRGKRPRYYLQNFHFQSGGWMTRESAQRYDTQVEVLFHGTANATRRQALVPLHEVFAGRDQRRLRLLDVGCGTGRFLDLAKQAWPRLPALGLDMSEAYVAEAKRHLKRWGWIDCIVGKGEPAGTRPPASSCSTNCRRRCAAPSLPNSRACSSAAGASSSSIRSSSATSRTTTGCSNFSRRTITSPITRGTSGRISARSPLLAGLPMCATSRPSSPR
jgi:hypothetical protein